jgi:hypothetical protein
VLKQILVIFEQGNTEKLLYRVIYIYSSYRFETMKKEQEVAAAKRLAEESKQRAITKQRL